MLLIVVMSAIISAAAVIPAVVIVSAPAIIFATVISVTPMARKNTAGGRERARDKFLRLGCQR